MTYCVWYRKPPDEEKCVYIEAEDTQEAEKIARALVGDVIRIEYITWSNHTGLPQ